MVNASKLFKDDEQDKLGNGFVPNESSDSENSPDANSDESLASQEKNPDGSDKKKNTGKDGAGGASSAALGAAESAIGAADTLGAGFNPVAAASTRAAMAAFASRNKKKAGIGGGIIGVVVALLLFASFSLIPLKIENIVQKLQNHFFATSQNAIEGESQTMLDHYIADHVIPGYATCGTTIRKDCHAKVGVLTSNPVSNIYKSWADAKLENTLATTYHIEFKYDSASKSWYLKAPGTNGGLGDKLSAHPTSAELDTEFKRSDRAELRSAVKSSMADETRWKQVYYRFKVGRLLEEKYGVRRCLVFCDAKDALADNVKAQVRTAKIYTVQRVLTPRTESLGIVLECLLSPACDPAKTTPSTGSDGAPALNGEPEDAATDGAVRHSLEDLAAKYGVDDAQALLKLYDDIETKGFAKYLITEMLTKFGMGEVLAGAAADKIPIIGWINQVAELINGANDAGPKLKKLAYITNAAAAVQMYTMYRSYVDEMHTGNLTSAEYGSMISSLGTGDVSNTADPIVGGSATAEQTPLYSYLIDGKTTGSTTVATSSLNPFLPATASAATATTSTATKAAYICGDGKAVPGGKYVCPEEQLGAGNDIANTIHDALNSPGLNVITGIAKVWGSTIGAIFNYVSAAVGDIFSPLFKAAIDNCSSIPIPGLCAEIDLFNQAAGKIMEFVTQWLIPNPFSTNMSGGRTFDMMAAGADVAGNDSAHTTLGGQALTAQQTLAIINEQTSSDQQQFLHTSFFARMFNTSSEYSFVSRLAMATPINLRGSAVSTVATTIGNPLHTIGRVLGTLKPNGTASAATTAVNDPFGVTQYGYPDGTLPSDPEAYWNAYCSDNADHAYQNDAMYNNPSKNWNQIAASGTPDPNNGMPVNNTTNPCMLIKATVGAVGGKYSDSNLTADDLATPGGSATTTATNSKVYILGDSLTVGMDGSGGLSTSLKAKGWQPTVNGVVGRTLSQGLDQAKTNTVSVTEAGTIVVELGTNPFGGSTASFNGDLKSLYDYLHSTNPSAHIYWVNYSSSKSPWQADLQQKTQLLTTFANANNITLIDWAGSAASKFTTDDTAMGIHPYQHYPEMAAVIIQALGQPPAASIAGGSGGSGNFTTNTAIHFAGVSTFLTRAATAVRLSGGTCAAIRPNCHNLCAHVAGLIWGYSSTGWPSAYIQWQAEVSNGNAHSGSDKYNIPVGALMFWKGSGADGHEAVYVGDGNVVSTDVLGFGGVYQATATKVTQWMGSGTYLGWSNPVFNSKQTWPSIP